MKTAQKIPIDAPTKRKYEWQNEPTSEIMKHQKQRIINLMLILPVLCCNIDNPDMLYRGNYLDLHI